MYIDIYVHTHHHISTTGEATEYSADHIVVATGGRPTTMNIPGSEFVVTSDDFFSLREDPGKTLFIGGGFIALEVSHARVCVCICMCECVCQSYSPY
jgi:pyruvate/2-oxoglutarate dehydrogenase complex dihydrolipoamide dehydrogenase (E3) component